MSGLVVEGSNVKRSAIGSAERREGRLSQTTRLAIISSLQAKCSVSDTEQLHATSFSCHISHSISTFSHYSWHQALSVKSANMFMPRTLRCSLVIAHYWWDLAEQASKEEIEAGEAQATQNVQIFTAACVALWFSRSILIRWWYGTDQVTGPHAIEWVYRLF